MAKAPQKDRLHNMETLQRGLSYALKQCKSEDANSRLEAPWIQQKLSVTAGYHCFFLKFTVPFFLPEAAERQRDLLQRLVARQKELEARGKGGGVCPKAAPKASSRSIRTSVPAAPNRVNDRDTSLDSGNRVAKSGSTATIDYAPEVVPPTDAALPASPANEVAEPATEVEVGKPATDASTDVAKPNKATEIAKTVADAAAATAADALATSATVVGAEEAPFTPPQSIRRRRPSPSPPPPSPTSPATTARAPDDEPPKGRPAPTRPIEIDPDTFVDPKLAERYDIPPDRCPSSDWESYWGANRETSLARPLPTPVRTREEGSGSIEEAKRSEVKVETLEWPEVLGLNEKDAESMCCLLQDPNFI